MGTTLPFSKSRVNAAGDGLRAYFTNDDPTANDLHKLTEDLEVIRAFRAAHQLPLTKATMGLRSMVRTEGFELEISQRLKRMTTILDKIVVREPHLDLARMQDLGGCRAVLNSIAEVRAVHRRIRKNDREKRFKDYIEDPAPSGYRGLHVIVEYDGRLIEVQLRTQVQHMWAVTIERLGGSLDADLKSGFGPPEILEFMQMISHVNSIEEAGEVVDQTTLDQLGTLRARADAYLRGGQP